MKATASYAYRTYLVYADTQEAAMNAISPIAPEGAELLPLREEDVRQLAEGKFLVTYRFSSGQEQPR